MCAHSLSHSACDGSMIHRPPEMYGLLLRLQHEYVIAAVNMGYSGPNRWSMFCGGRERGRATTAHTG